MNANYMGSSESLGVSLNTSILSAESHLKATIQTRIQLKLKRKFAKYQRSYDTIVISKQKSGKNEVGDDYIIKVMNKSDH